MSKNKNPYNWKSSKVLKRAMETFERLTEALRKKADALGAGAAQDDVDAAQLTKQILAHQGAWKMAKDALRQYRDDESDKGGVGKNGIDFAKAKEEVLGRIARLVARGAGPKVS